MSDHSDLLISVPRSSLPEFYIKYPKLVETFSRNYVTISENKSLVSNLSNNIVYFKVNFHLDPVNDKFNAEELIDRIQKYVESSLGWAGERGEDSSYDSEFEEDVSHRTASRTPSDTLAAEFAEYVTLAPLSPPPNQAKIDFAMKLGYSEHLARTALKRLGPDPPRNELLAELIKLAAKRPLRATTPPQTLDPEPQPDRAALRHIVIDGSNVAMSHGNMEIFSCRGIEICVDWFRARGHRDISVFVPKWRKEATRLDNPVSDRDCLERLERDRILHYTPSRHLGGKRLVCYDDRYILKLAAETDGVVVSNDNYRDLAVESPEFRKVIEERLLMYTFVNDRFMPPDDPLGRSGPTLDAFLRAPLAHTDPPPPCPYGRKCTYGNKCKFYHPERAGRPHKSVAETLSERAARNALHTLSLPPGGYSSELKKPLARAHSATPRLADPTIATHFDKAQQPGSSQTMLHPSENSHRKLARQSIFNPVCDPRLHATAARVCSAPVGAAGASPLYKAASSLSPCASEGALHHWEARRRMHYHLANIFPEVQVVEAMNAYPDEIDAQKMCAIILARYQPSEATLPYPLY